MNTYVDVIVPLPIAGQYTYLVPEAMEATVQAGCRVIVPFGRKKYYTAIVTRIHHVAPQDYETKPVQEVLDEHPVLFRRQYDFWLWLSEYYLCTLGDVYKAAMPSGMKLESETIVRYNPDYVAAAPLSNHEQGVLDILAAHEELCITQVEKLSGVKHVLPIINSLLAKEAVAVKEELKHQYKPKLEARVRFTESVSDENHLQQLFSDLSRAPRQLQLLMKYIELSGWGSGKRTVREVRRAELLEASGASSTVLAGMVEKNIFHIYYQEVGRLISGQTQTAEMNSLSEVQLQAYRSVLSVFSEKNVCLLHGVTASGKTEVYIHLIQQVIRAGKQVLYLVPEIALTTQITDRLRAVFGSRLGVYHSKFPDAERVEIWQKQLSDTSFDIILGARSSVFLPFRRLGLVIVDEEHENTYKQQDPAPRYHARSAAIMLASMFGAKTLLGTATPSIESYFNAQHGKYGFVQLTERHKQIRMPHIEVVDIKELARKKRMVAQFSPLLLQHMSEALQRKEQIILFQNRRGFAPMIECNVCAWVPRCKNCDVSLTYHKRLDQLTCHYCGYTCAVPKVCPACGGTELISKGFGTEKIEDDVRRIFPQASVARMDLDTTRTRSAYERIISDFVQGKTDVLIGTQMVSKGLDFERVSVVGILNADSMLSYPDFRSYERAFQLMAQVAGRAGRKHAQGLVVLQTKSPDLPLIHQVVHNDYVSLYKEQVEERGQFKYPPFYRLVYVCLKHRKEDVLDRAASVMASYLRNGLGDRVLGPDRPPVARIQTYYIRKIVVKIERQASMDKVRAFLLQVQQNVVADERFRSLSVFYDVDPM